MRPLACLLACLICCARLCPIGGKASSKSTNPPQPNQPRQTPNPTSAFELLAPDWALNLPQHRLWSLRLNLPAIAESHTAVRACLRECVQAVFPPLSLSLSLACVGTYMLICMCIWTPSHPLTHPPITTQQQVPKILPFLRRRGQSFAPRLPGFPRPSDEDIGACCVNA